MSPPPNTARRSRFAVMASQPGGLSLEAAVARVEVSLAEMAAEYGEWLQRDLAALNQDVDRATESLGRDDAAMAAVYRRASALRDLGTTFGRPLITLVADRLCELVHRLRAGRLYGGNAVHAHLAALRLVGQPLYAGRAPADARPLLDGLSAIVAKFPAPDAVAR
jgi:hypothetical protein